MLKLKDILKEDIKVKETDVDGRIYNWKEEMEKGKFDPENPTVHLLGYGTATYKSLLKNTAFKMPGSFIPSTNSTLRVFFNHFL